MLWRSDVPVLIVLASSRRVAEVSARSKTPSAASWSLGIMVSAGVLSVLDVVLLLLLLLLGLLLAVAFLCFGAESGVLSARIVLACIVARRHETAMLVPRLILVRTRRRSIRGSSVCLSSCLSSGRCSEVEVGAEVCLCLVRV